MMNTFKKLLSNMRVEIVKFKSDLKCSTNKTEKIIFFVSEFALIVLFPALVVVAVIVDIILLGAKK